VVSRLALYLLGPPRIERDGEPIKVDTRKATALLAYLALAGERQRRASLVNLLWPDADRTRGRAALRRTLYALRKALGGAWEEGRAQAAHTCLEEASKLARELGYL
jgi:DNA-binding SARP family transcriptional activator